MSGILPANIANTARNMAANPTAMPGDIRMVPHTIYDTYAFPTTVSGPIKHFTVPEGQTQNGLTKDATHTNLSEPGKLANGQDFSFRYIRISLVLDEALTHHTTAVLAAYRSVLAHSRFRVKCTGTSREFENEFHGSRLLGNEPVAGTTATDTNAILSSICVAPLSYDIGSPINLVDNSGAAVNFNVEQLANSSEIAAALTVLNTAGARMHIDLIGFLKQPK